jgi:hypothetical protein
MTNNMDRSYAMPKIDGFVDSTYSNDAAPSISKSLGNDFYLQLWVDYPTSFKHLSDFADTENYTQYHLSLVNDEIGIHDGLLSTNDLSEVEKTINDFKLNKGI